MLLHVAVAAAALAFAPSAPPVRPPTAAVQRHRHAPPVALAGLESLTTEYLSSLDHHYYLLYHLH